MYQLNVICDPELDPGLDKPAIMGGFKTLREI